LPSCLAALAGAVKPLLQGAAPRVIRQDLATPVGAAGHGTGRLVGL